MNVLLVDVMYDIVNFCDNVIMLVKCLISLNVCEVKLVWF